MKISNFKSIDESIASPNFDDRPCNTQINTLVVHAISLPPDCFENKHVEAFFTNQLDPKSHPHFIEICHLKVSSHFYIKRCGTVIQFVNTDYRAWHAGESFFEGEPRVNDFSIGIELEGCDTLPFEAIQYKKLGSLTKELMLTYPLITLARIVGHSDISPGRKTDPGPYFNWGHYFNLLST